MKEFKVHWISFHKYFDYQNLRSEIKSHSVKNEKEFNQIYSKTSLADKGIPSGIRHTFYQIRSYTFEIWFYPRHISMLEFNSTPLLLHEHCTRINLYQSPSRSITGGNYQIIAKMSTGLCSVLTVLSIVGKKSPI